ncbi:MAG: DUF2321 domain-containing protein [Actinobacteria bacterium]|nr:DUF2321 domain-containing protein [Actinomycetota bacterium]
MWDDDDGSDWYDTAQICQNGHIINQMTVENPVRSAFRCETCGEETITACPSCKTPIRGYYHSEDMNVPLFEVPKFCSSCGEPYPWTDRKIKLAKELADQAKGINKKEREILKESIVDIILETPSAEVSASKIKKITEKSGPWIKEALFHLLTGAANEYLLKASGLK